MQCGEGSPGPPCIAGRGEGGTPMQCAEGRPHALRGGGAGTPMQCGEGSPVQCSVVWGAGTPVQCGEGGGRPRPRSGNAHDSAALCTARANPP